MVKPQKTLLYLAMIALIIHPTAHAGGFSLYTESSAAAIGNFAAGVAAEVTDASIGWYNPAGLVMLQKQQVVLGGVGVFPSTELTGVSTYTTNNPLLVGRPPYTQSFNHLQGAESAVVPSFHYALPLGKRAAFGFSVVSPFGLSTHYFNNSPVRYAATYSDLKTVNISPELGGLLTDHWSIGGGLDFQYANVEFDRMIGSPAYLQFYSIAIPDSGVTPTTLDSESKNSGDSFAMGFHMGTMLMFDDNHTRVGLNYQSGTSHLFNGQSQLTGRLADPSLIIADPLNANPKALFISNTLSSDAIHLPAIVTLSGYRDLNPKWALLGSLVYSGWSTFQSITLNDVAAGVPSPSGDGSVVQTLVKSTTIENYRNTWRVALGANYHVNDQWMMRFGGGYDQTPTVTAERDVRLPDSDRWALSIGAHYQVLPSLGFDLGYTYLFGVHNAVINNTQAIGATSSYLVDAISKNSAQLVGLQMVWTIDSEK
ncbi:MAG: outer membrane protein transport protein [Legionellales bacterium]|nr:outer membrane protein transport protein [Legionellales bacterium]